MGEQRCMASAGPLTHRLAVFNRRGGIERFLCGLPLEPTGGPCVTCGHGQKSHGPVAGVCHSCREVHMGDTFPKPDAEHSYAEPAACPVHGEQGGQR